MNPRAHLNQAGFTLVEVLAALLIFSLAIVGLSQAGAQSVAHAQRLTDKANADIVADNVLIRARMLPPVIETKTGVEAAGGQDYDWQLETAQTQQEGLLQLSVTVRQGDDRLMVRRAYLAVPARQTSSTQPTTPAEPNP